MKRIRKIRYILAVVLIIGIIAIIGSTILRYNIEPNEIYRISGENLIPGGDFENFNKTAGDCCKTNPNASRVYEKKNSDAFEGTYSLNLTSEYQCACVSYPILEFNNTDKYLLSVYYKGDNPRFCNWVEGDRKCMPNKRLISEERWANHMEILEFTEKSTSSSIFLYADSRDGKTYTNLYDDLQVRRLIEIENQSEYQFNPEEEYVIKTKADNRVVGEMISDVGDDGMAYFLVRGKPIVTLQFPWSEIVLVVIMLIVVIRLLFKRDDDEIL